MKLLLTSSGNTNTSIEKALLNLLGKPFNEVNLTFIPTAANLELGDKSWLVKDMHNFQKLNFNVFDIIDIAAVEKNRWLSSFEKADILVFGGGKCKYLLEWMEKSGVKETLPKLLENKIYVGISAGSMVTAKTVSLPSENLLYYEQYGNVTDMPGLGFIDFEIRPHLNSSYFPKVRIDFLNRLAKDTKISFYAIDDNTAIQVVDDKVSITSEGEWKKFN